MADAVDTVVTQLVAEQDRMLQVHAIVGTVTLIFACIDAMAHAALPPGRERVKQRDFEQWVDR